MSLISTIPNSTNINLNELDEKIILEAKNQEINKYQFLNEIMMIC